MTALRIIEAVAIVLAVILVIDALNRAAEALGKIAGALTREEERRARYERELRAMTDADVRPIR